MLFKVRAFDKNGVLVFNLVMSLEGLRSWFAGDFFLLTANPEPHVTIEAYASRITIDIVQDYGSLTYAELREAGFVAPIPSLAPALR